MDKSFAQFSPEQMKALMESETARNLLNMLKNRHADSMQQALSDAQRGDMKAAKAALQACMSDPGTQQLLKKLREEQHG